MLRLIQKSRGCKLAIYVLEKVYSVIESSSGIDSFTLRCEEVGNQNGQRDKRRFASEGEKKRTRCLSESRTDC